MSYSEDKQLFIEMTINAWKKLNIIGKLFAFIPWLIGMSLGFCMSEIIVTLLFKRSK